VPDLKGYRGDGPVRIGNAAVAQNQHDTYGSAILAATPMFFDRRLPRMGDENLFRRLEPLGEMAAKLAFEPDAGIWEYRGRKRIHTHSASMCWAGCQRLEAFVQVEPEGAVRVHCYTTWDTPEQLEAFLERGYTVDRMLVDIVGVEPEVTRPMEKIF